MAWFVYRGRKQRMHVAREADRGGTRVERTTRDYDSLPFANYVRLTFVTRRDNKEKVGQYSRSYFANYSIKMNDLSSIL